ncbi:MAG: hypothetical protein IT208_16035 [Chthonomonadales bacterium]|nr:hypothetical protein [Chthonomonadales bacterium]
MDSLPVVSPAVGWNTWSFERLTALSYVDGDRLELELRVSILDEIERERTSTFGWGDVVDLGPHAYDGSYLRLELNAGFEARFELEAASEGDRLALRVTPTRTSARRVVVEMVRPGRCGSWEREGDTWRLGDWRVACEGALPPHTLYLRAPGPCAAGGRGERLVVAASRDEAPGGADAFIDAARERYAGRCVRSGGALGEAAEAITRAAAWNTVYDVSGRGICTTASRDWCRDWQSVVLFGWDTYFHGLVAAVEDPAVAWANFAASLAGATPSGFVPNWSLGSGVATVDRSQPPVGAFAVWKTWLRDLDDGRLATLYPGLLRWHRWWMGARGTPEGLLAWGSDADAAYAFPELKQAMYGAQICCCYESGMDNSPMFDGVPYDPVTGRMAQADVGLTSLYALDAECLAAIAGALGRGEDAASLGAEADAVRERINALLWCEEEGIYLNRRADGRWSRRRSPTSFYPLLCGAPDARQLARLVDGHLLNPAEFWGEYPLPSIARSDPAYRDNDYWRGRIWAPMVYLVAAGLRRCGRRETARALAGAGLRMMLANWREGRAIYENYSAETGSGGDVPNADPLYVWGGLLGLAALEEVVDATPEGLRFCAGLVGGASVERLPLRGASYDVHAHDDRLEVWRDGTLYARLGSVGALVVDRDANRVGVEARAGAEWAVGGWAPGGTVWVGAGGVPKAWTADADGWVRGRVP